jgi:hypothetical protein
VGFQATSTDFGALKVLQDTNRARLFVGSFANPIDVPGVFFVRAVRKIQPGNIHSEPEEVAESLFRIGGRPDSADDLGSPGVVAPGVGSKRERRGGVRVWVQVGKIARE